MNEESAPCDVLTWRPVHNLDFISGRVWSSSSGFEASEWMIRPDEAQINLQPDCLGGPGLGGGGKKNATHT